MDLKKEFQKFNIDVFGVCSADEYNAVKKTDYKFCIVALFPYFCGYSENSNLSIYTHGLDYHEVTRKILTSVAQGLRLHRFEVHSDIGPQIERTLAVNAGLAYVGKNQMAINEKYGSYFFIGYIACDGDFSLSTPLKKSCMGCNRCIEACPTGSLTDGFNCETCLSAITQKKGELTNWEIDLIRENKMIFGCDICQKVCPHNKDVSHTLIPEFSQNRICRLNHSDLQGITNRAFKEKYSNRAFAWRGKAVLERNIKIVEDNNSQ